MQNSPVLIQVTVKYNDLASFATNYSSRLTSQGLFLFVKQASPVGTIVRFEIFLQQGTRIFSGIGEVTWIKPMQRSKGRSLYSLVLRFVSLDPGSEAVLTRALSLKEDTKREFFQTDSLEIDTMHDDQIDTTPYINPKKLIAIPVGPPRQQTTDTQKNEQNIIRARKEHDTEKNSPSSLLIQQEPQTERTKVSTLPPLPETPYIFSLLDSNFTTIRTEPTNERPTSIIPLLQRQDLPTALIELPKEESKAPRKRLTRPPQTALRTEVKHHINVLGDKKPLTVKSKAKQTEKKIDQTRPVVLAQLEKTSTASVPNMPAVGQMASKKTIPLPAVDPPTQEIRIPPAELTIETQPGDTPALMLVHSAESQEQELQQLLQESMLTDINTLVSWAKTMIRNVPKNLDDIEAELRALAQEAKVAYG